MVKKLMKSIREYRTPSIICPLLVVLEVALEVLIPFLMADLIDVGLENADLPYIYKMGFALIVAAMLSLLFGALAGKYAAIASAGFAKNLRGDMFHHIQDFSFANIDKFSTASLVTRLTTDVTNVQNAYQMIVRVLVRAPVMLVFALVMAMTVNFELSVIFLGAVPLLGIGLFLIIMKAHPYFEKVFREYDHLNGVVQENLRGVRVVKAYVREEQEDKKFFDISGRIYKLFCSAEKIVAFNGPLMQFSMYTCILLLSYFSAKLIVGGSMGTGELMTMIVYATQILMSLMMLSMVFVMVIISRASSERIVEVLEEKSTLHNPENPRFDIRDGAIDFENVSFIYSQEAESAALSGVNLHIASGETVGIIGGTGSAKSTLVQLIARLYDVTEGSIKVGGVDVREYDLETLRDNVAMVLQKNVLFSGSIKENMRWGNPDATDEEIMEACRLAQADSFIQTFPDGYDTHIEQGGTNVSGGQRQRLCIARALLKKPKILILDDSTSAVDTKTDALIRKAMREVIPGTTKLIIAQRISSIEEADHVIVMDNGRVNGWGTPAELLKTNDIYREVYESQMKGAEKHE
ncbi:MAG TPA: ABC transporter ATP-binding protein/permease [Candidatus Ruthenibacterium merdavium]|uniref:ABC transporter ATP-binding protein/permease n=1 Tax=Candidatus Ruthenibacterium merdavium TaxID=2838752 RepID=A0A9D2Q3P7_9FIRM|nr:ABC transporter ATP-binding protein/permease [Candidatus Ruthenibacterium merdavium]